MIDIRNLTHIYAGSRKTRPRKALDDLTLHVAEGEFCILSGPNGSGKSTLFRILCGMALPSAGTIRLAGLDLVREPRAVRRHIGVVFQSPAVDKHLTVMENLRLQASLYRLPAREFNARLTESIAWADIADRLDDKVDTLSGGLSRQVELAKCLLTRPSILLADEPTAGLDPASRRNFVATLHRLQRERKMTVLMTSHIFSEAEEVDRVAIMKDGVLLAHDRPQTLRAALGREMVVVHSHDPLRLEARIADELGLRARRHGEEIRIEETENGACLPILARLLDHFRADITFIAIKQPGLEDVFIHLTSTAPAPVAPMESVPL